MTSTVDAALPGSEPPALDEAFHGFFATLQQLDIAPIAVIAGEAILDPRCASDHLPSTAAWQTTSPSSSASARHAAPSIPTPPSTPRRS